MRSKSPEREIVVSFGVCAAQDGMKFLELKEMVSEAERLGFDSFWLFDHLFGFPFPDRQLFLESWTTLSALSTLTSRIRLGTLVTNIQYRLPSLVAKMGATFDVISGGRLELGLGAGGTARADWHQRLGYLPEYVAYGTSFQAKPSIRIRMLEEATKVIRLMWTQEETCFSGRYYRIKKAVCNPRPVQKPHPRIWIAGGGEQLLLRVAAKYANGTNFAWNLTPADFGHKLSVLRRHCDEFGTDYDSIVKSLSAGVLMADSEDHVSIAREKLMRRYSGAEGYLPYALRRSGLVGSPDDCVERLEEFVQAGAEYFMLVFVDLQQMELFGKTVLPKFS